MLLDFVEATIGAGKPAPPGVPGTQLCRYDLPAPRYVPHNYATGHSTGRTIRGTSSGSDGDRRRASSVVSDNPATHRITTLLVRRWDARGVSHGVSEGRC